MSSEWSPEEIRKKLKLGAKSTGTVSANVFFKDMVSADELAAAADRAIKEAAMRLGRNTPDATVGRVSRLAKSVSVRGDPDLIGELSNADTVKAILPSEIEDIYPKPVRKKVVE